MQKQKSAVCLALLAALFYSVSTPVSKLLLESVPPTFMASFLYLGAGIGVGAMYAFHWKKEDKSERLSKSDLPCTIGMIVLDIAAPILLMLGIKFGSASSASLLGNFEIVATTLIALAVFHEPVSKKLWAAILLITASTIILTFDFSDSLHFSVGSMFVVAATLCWGFENNCTRRISEKSTYQIVTLKGIFSGAGSFVIAIFAGEKLPGFRFVAIGMVLGFVAYGLSIFMYVRAQRTLGAARTSAYYAINPFTGALLSFLLTGEKVTVWYFAALAVMIAGTVLVIKDTMNEAGEKREEVGGRR